MKVTFYGNLAETIGREVDVMTAPGVTVGGVRRLLQERSAAALASLGRDGVVGCVDDEIVGDHVIVPDGKHLAFLPVLSGG